MELQLLTRVYRTQEAEMLAELLTNNGIQVMLGNEEVSSLYPVIPGMLSEIDILVHAEELEKARQLLQDFFSPQAQIDELPEEGGAPPEDPQ